MSPSCIFTGAGIVALALATTTHAGPAPTGACCDSDPLVGGCSIQTEADCIASGVQPGYQGDDSDCSECSQNNCLEDDVNCQEPNIGQFPGGTILTSAITADNIVTTAATDITRICFWGAYIDIAALVDCDSEVTADAITITIYQNQLPLTIPPRPNLALVPFVTTATIVSRRATGQLFNLGGFPDPVREWEFTVTLDAPFSVGANDCVWIQIENAVTSVNPACAFFWEVSPEFVNDPILGNGDDLGWDVDNDAPNDFDMAFCVNQALGDPTTCALPLLPQCVLDVPAGSGRCISADDLICLVNTELECMNIAGATFTPDIDCREACNIANPRTFPGGGGIPGCTDPACCTLTCDASPVCCFIVWDDICVDIALDIGCVGQPLCGGEAEVAEVNCQRFSVANAFNSTFDPADPVNDQFTAADDFTPADGGAITLICWQGIPAPQDLMNPPPDNFTVTYYDDNGGLPGNVIGGPFSQSGLSLTDITVIDTNLNLGLFDILEYTATHAAVGVSAGVCYWIEIKNGVGGDMDAKGNPSSWFWQIASTGNEAPFFAGNGRLALDGQADGLGPNGYDNTDLIGGIDLSICFKDLGPLQVPACGLDTIYLTGPSELVCGFNGVCPDGLANLGYSSGCLDTNADGNCIGDEFEQRRSAQPFTLPKGNWNVSQLFVFGFVPAGITNEELNFEIFTRTDMIRPIPDDSLIAGSIVFDATPSGVDDPQGGATVGALHSISTNFNLVGGDYYLTVWASNSLSAATGILAPSNFAWFGNSDVPPELNNICGDPCVGATPQDVAAGNFGCDGTDCASTVGATTFWRGRIWPPLPDGFGFGQYGVPGLAPAAADGQDPDPDPADLYNTALWVRGAATTSICGNGQVEPGETCDPPGPGCSSICQGEAQPCPWDCGGDNDGNVGIVDFLALLGQWTQIDTSCDFDGGGVGIVDFLELLGNWGDCP